MKTSKREKKDARAAMAPAAGDKAQLLAQLLAGIDDALQVMVAAALSARDAATHEENKAENDKDTRAIEAGYLAGAQAARAAELRRTLLELEQLTPRDFADNAAIAATALVDLQDDHSSARSVVFLCPHGAGMKTRLADVEIQVVSPQAPLGQALLGKKAGDSFEVRIAGKERCYTIAAVR